jgi:hypothetical protein
VIGKRRNNISKYITTISFHILSYSVLTVHLIIR